ncbi:S1 RNA-binding domain-containing protein [Duganella sp. BuS-21]|uniref:S1 RNA-binding domain-containing protein n=1 Tax=Duganella sp. BuS-21 TaxID=2943848 RepID=UPI0035A58AEF
MLKELFAALIGSRLETSPRADSSPIVDLPPNPVLAPGVLCQGRVSYVGPNWAKIAVMGTEAFVSASEISNRKIESASDVLSTGQDVELVILTPSERKPGQWNGSLAAVTEVRKREQLAQLTSGQRLKGVVDTLKPRGVTIRAGELEFYVPIAEMAWNPVEYPADVVSIGQVVDFEVLRLTIPEWQGKWRQEKSGATASIRSCLPRPTPKYVPMAFSALPFTIKARARRSAILDAVLMHVLAEIAAGNSSDDISIRTRLPAPVLASVLNQLEEVGMLSEGRLTSLSRSIIEADDLAREINEANYGGRYAATAEPGSRLSARSGIPVNPPFPQELSIPEYPANWPRPAFNPRADSEFLGRNGEEIPDEIIGFFLDAERRSVLAKHLSDRRLQIMIAKDGVHQPVCTYVTDHWLFAALWSAFDAVGTNRPYRPERGYERASTLLLVKCAAFDRADRLPQSVYLEPYTKTLWVERGEGTLRPRQLKENAFPPTPVLGQAGLTLESGAVATRLEPEVWCSFHFRSTN